MRCALLGSLLVMLSACQPSAQLGAACMRASECNAPLVCGFGRCRPECREQRDCPLGALCLLDESGGGSCALTSDPDCRAPGSTCPTGLACIGGACVNACATVTDCPPGSVCIAVGDRTRCERADVLEIDAGPSDAGPRPDASADAGDVSACPFGPLVPMDDVNDPTRGGASDPSLSDDGLYLWWFTGLSGHFYATRTDRFGAFGTATNHAYIPVSSVELFDDGLSMIAYDRKMTTLVQYTRASRSVEFADPSMQVAGGLQLEEPAIDASALHLVAMMGTTPVKASRAAVGDAFGPVTELTELSSFAVRYPNLSADGLTLAFASEGTIYLSRRPTVDGLFGTPESFDGMPGDSEEDPHLSRDGWELYVSSARRGTREIWVSRRVCP